MSGVTGPVRDAEAKPGHGAYRTGEQEEPPATSSSSRQTDVSARSETPPRGS